MPVCVRERGGENRERVRKREVKKREWVLARG
jgi:hypothetical protein